MRFAGESTPRIYPLDFPLNRGHLADQDWADL